MLPLAAEIRYRVSQCERSDYLTDPGHPRNRLLGDDLIILIVATGAGTLTDKVPVASSAAQGSRLRRDTRSGRPPVPSIFVRPSPLRIPVKDPLRHRRGRPQRTVQLTDQFQPGHPRRGRLANAVLQDADRGGIAIGVEGVGQSDDVVPAPSAARVCRADSRPRLAANRIAFSL
jgi:hypothetical protein